MNLVPMISPQGSLINGEYIEALSFCKKHCGEGKCKSFYSSLQSVKKNAFVSCPYGMTVYPSDNGIVFTCMRERDTYDKLKAKQISNSFEKVYNPVLNSEQLLRLIKISIGLEFESQQLVNKRINIDSISHEVKQLNAQVKDNSDMILLKLKNDEDEITLTNEDLHYLREEARNIFVCSSMIASRYTLYNYENNPSALTLGSTFP